MRFLREHDFRVVTLAEAVEKFEADENCAPKTIALTFDDGFLNFYEQAFPVLAEHDFAATVFLVTDFCGKSNDWQGNPLKLPRQKLLGWSDIKELSRHKIEFGAHTKTHPDLTRLGVEKAEAQIVESKKIIETALGKKVETFAYPYGRFDEQTKRIAAENFRAACSVRLGSARRTSDFFALERIDAYYLGDRKILRSFATPPFENYLRFRQSLRDVKNVFVRA